MNSRTVASALTPMASAYDRMKDFLKMPEGQRETLSRSNPSRRVMLIFVLSAIDLRAICRRSRSWRKRPPKLSMGAPVSQDMKQGHHHVIAMPLPALPTQLPQLTDLPCFD